jgi:hypothetical protein
MSKPLIFESVTIGSNTYKLTNADATEISNEMEKLMVDDGQEIPSSVLGGLTVPIYDLDVQTDPNVLMDSTVDPDTDLTTMTLDGASGSSTISIADVYVCGVLKFDQPSPYVELKAQRRASGSPITIT